MEKHPFRLRTRILLPLMGVVALLLLAIVWGFQLARDHQLNQDMKEYHQVLERWLGQTLEDHGDLMHSMLRILSGSPELTERFKRGDYDSIRQNLEQLGRDRWREHDAFEVELFDAVGSRLFGDHPHSHAAAKVPLYPLLKTAMAEGDVVNGLVMSPTGHLMISAIMPWRHQDTVLGYLQFSIPLRVLLEHMQGVFGVEYYLSLYKTGLERASWEDHRRLHDLSTQWEAYDGVVICHQSSPLTLPGAVSRWLSTHSPAHATEQIAYTRNGRYFRSIFLPLQTYDGIAAGDIIVIRDTTAATLASHRLQNFLVVGALTAFAALGVGFYIILRRTERKLEHNRRALLQHASEREAMQAAHLQVLKEEERLLRHTQQRLKDSLKAAELARDRAARLARDKQASEARFRHVAGAANDAFIILDEQGCIEFWNPAAENLFGYSEQEAMGQPVHMLVAPPSIREQADAALQHFLATGQGALVNTTVELTAQDRAGREFGVELSLAAAQVQGRRQAIGILRDISERKAAERDLEQQMNELRRFQRVSVGRELRLRELKQENARLKEQLKQSAQQAAYAVGTGER